MNDLERRLAALERRPIVIGVTRDFKLVTLTATDKTITLPDQVIFDPEQLKHLSCTEMEVNIWWSRGVSNHNVRTLVLRGWEYTPKGYDTYDTYGTSKRASMLRELLMACPSVTKVEMRECGRLDDSLKLVMLQKISVLFEVSTKRQCFKSVITEQLEGIPNAFAYVRLS